MQRNRIPRPWVLFVFSIVLWVEQAGLAGAFVQTTMSPGSKQIEFTGGSIAASGRSKLSEPSGFPPCRRSYSGNRNKRQSTELFSFMGSDGGLFGIGTPELVSVKFNQSARLFAFVLTRVELETL